MALSFDFINKIVTVPQSDCSLVSGTLYDLDTEWFKNTLNAELADEEHIWVEDIYRHNTTVTVAGTTYARTIEIINGWQVQFSPDSQWTVRLQGSNNNIFDVGGGVLVQNQVQVIPTNSAGLISASADVLAADIWAYIVASGNTAETELIQARKAAQTARNLSA